MPSLAPLHDTSVIIPAYNAGKYLAEAIESVLAQQPPPREIIVVNDGSTDDTAAVARGFEQVTCLQQANQGIAGARNTGIGAASGNSWPFWTPTTSGPPASCKPSSRCWSKGRRWTWSSAWRSSSTARR